MMRAFNDTTILVVLCAILGVLSGCAVVGPTSISMGRADYNEAINKTDDDQLLMSIVRGRYGETFSLLAVTGVAANVRFGTNAGVNIGFGPDENYAGNLVPFSGGLGLRGEPHDYLCAGARGAVCPAVTVTHPVGYTFIIKSFARNGSFFYAYNKQNQRHAKPRLSAGAVG